MTSTIPAALDALIAKLSAAPGLAGAQVLDGLPLEYPQADCIAIGISTEDVSVDSERADAGLGSRRRERVDVTNVARSWTGDKSLSPRRLRVFELVAAVEAVLAQDRKLGGVVDRARVTSVTYTPVRDPKGTGAFAEFRIVLDAFTT